MNSDPFTLSKISYILKVYSVVRELIFISILRIRENFERNLKRNEEFETVFRVPNSHFCFSNIMPTRARPGQIGQEICDGGGFLTFFFVPTQTN